MEDLLTITPSTEILQHMCESAGSKRSYQRFDCGPYAYYVDVEYLPKIIKFCLSGLNLDLQIAKFSTYIVDTEADIITKNRTGVTQKELLDNKLGVKDVK